MNRLFYAFVRLCVCLAHTTLYNIGFVDISYKMWHFTSCASCYSVGELHCPSKNHNVFPFSFLRIWISHWMEIKRFCEIITNHMCWLGDFNIYIYIFIFFECSHCWDWCFSCWYWGLFTFFVYDTSLNWSKKCKCLNLKCSMLLWWIVNCSLRCSSTNKLFKFNSEQSISANKGSIYLQIYWLRYDFSLSQLNSDSANLQYSSDQIFKKFPSTSSVCV